MEWNDLLIDGYERVLVVIKRVFKGITIDDLDWQPGPDSNSIAWLAWHLTRIQDDHIASLMREDQLWIKDGWYAKFNRQLDSSDIGFGYTSEQVAAFESPGVDTILAYHEAVLDRTKRYLLQLSSSDLDRELNEPRYQPLPTVGVRLISVLADNLQHAGQMAYIRGLRQGKGWQGH